VLRFDPSLDPIMRIALSGTGELNDMRNLAERKIKLDLETIKGVASAQIKGGLEDEIQVNVDQERLAALGIPLQRVRDVVGVSNVIQPGGSLRGADSHFLIRTMNEFDTWRNRRSSWRTGAAPCCGTHVATVWGPRSARRSRASAARNASRSPPSRKATPTR
jgi:HAE1 family hydrophobic/amphiphilic exporter-1